MGDVSVIARRLEDGHVQYGWSGNGGYFRNVGLRLQLWYEAPEDVEYLFGLGQTKLIGKRGSENGGYRWVESHGLTGEAFWLGNTEREIFSRIAFVDYGYFYDLDHRWYYIIPGPFRIKVPLNLIEGGLDEDYYEFDYLRELEDQILRYIFTEYMQKNRDFEYYLEQEGCNPETVMTDIEKDGQLNIWKLYDKYQNIWRYFDDWIVIKTNEDDTEIVGIVVRKREDIHVETCNW